MSDHDSQKSAANEWAPCPEGEVQRMVGRNRTARLNRTLTKSVSAGAICLALMGGWALTSWRGADAPAGSNFANISCDDVCAQLGQYADGKLDATTAAQITEHLRLCPECGPVYEQMKKTEDKVAMSTGTAGTGACTDPDCPHCRPRRPHLLLAGEPEQPTLTLAMR